jgi:endonuclease/exonuclease/phosphatase family metal-dependent hydrolase
MPKLRVVSYNLHKGLNSFNRRLVLPDMAHALTGLAPDLLCLQEVQGEHQRRAHRYAGWQSAQAHWLAEQLQFDCHYADHARHRWGHHGNALLSRWPQQEQTRHSLTLHALEQRGLVHAHIQLPDGLLVHLISCHLNLLENHRTQQIHQLKHYIQQHIPADAALVLAGDFNDWRGRIGPQLHELALVDAYQQVHGQLARTFPARWPSLPLDRVYIRGLSATAAWVPVAPIWHGLSDHRPLVVELAL